MSISQNRACQRLSSLGIRQDVVHSYIDLIAKWQRNEGVEHTISRLKQLKTAFIRRLAGQEPDYTWVAHRNGLPKGPLKRIFELNKPQKALSALMAYSAHVSQDITPNQRDKFFNSVEKAAPIDTSHMTRGLECQLSSIAYPNMYEFPIKGRVPNINGIGSRRDPDHSCIRDVRRLPDIESFVLANRSALAKSEFTSVGEIVTLKFSDMINPLPVGRIGFIQEPGYKLRAVANPHRGLQYLLDPLKQSLLRKLKTVKCDCTFNQEEGWLWAQSQIQRGNPVASVDLSDATNLFPLSFQVEVLKNSYRGNQFMTDLVNLFEDCSKGEWVVRGERRVRWSKGQPLGLAPSFPSFALSHHAVMYLVFKDLAIQRGNTKLIQSSLRNFDSFLASDWPYRILGDDIVMTQSLERRYRAKMESLGCEISEQKCLSSNRAAEFGSRVVTKDYVLIQNKWKMSSDRNFIDLLKALGPKWIQNLPTRQRKVALAISSIPEDMGGLGWNPKGIPLDIRRQAAEFILKQSEEQIVHRLDVQASLNRYKDNPEINQGLIVSNKEWSVRLDSDLTIHSDRPSRSIMETITDLFRFRKMTVKKDDVPEGYTLMDVSSDPRGSTQLKSYENRLSGSVLDILLPDDQEQFLNKLIFIEENVNKISEVVSNSQQLNTLSNPYSDKLAVKALEETKPKEVTRVPTNFGLSKEAILEKIDQSLHSKALSEEREHKRKTRSSDLSL